MKRALFPAMHLLLIEDDPIVADQIMSAVCAHWPKAKFTRAYDQALLATVLTSQDYCTVISKHDPITGFDSREVLRRLHEHDSPTPLIILSSSLTEEQIVDLFHAGAQDCVRKDNLSRLVFVLERTLKATDDLLGRRRAETQLRHSEERFRTLAEHSEDVFWFTSLNPDRTDYVSPAVQNVWGRPAEEFYRDPQLWRTTVFLEDQLRVESVFADFLAGKLPKFAMEYRVVHPDGAVRWVFDHATPIRNIFGEIVRVSGIARDITDRKQDQEQAFRAQRIENLGLLAAGIAHDLNNVLAPVVMAGALLRTRVQDDVGLRLLATVEKSGMRGTALVRQLTTFARGIGGESQHLQLRHLLHDIAELATVTFPKNITIEEQLPSDLWTVRGNATQLHQVFLNLCINARDAMPQGGTLTLFATNRRLDQASAAAIEGARAGAYLAVNVRDTGTGIAPEVLERIWEPFFTTKEASKGSGLGLSTVRGILHDHGGFISLRTVLGTGSTFTVYLPSTETTVDSQSPFNLPSSAPYRGHGELILLVDDDEEVLQMTSHLLTQHGYRVVAASSATDALGKFAAQTEQIALLLTDFGMPVMDGRTLAGLIRQFKPSLPIMAMSGANSVAGAHDGSFADAFVRKPFTSATMLGTISQVLHGQQMLSIS